MRRLRAAWLLLGVTLLSGCGTGAGGAGGLRDLVPGERPSIQSDEAGLWMQMDRVERNLETSGALVTDPRLTAYVRDVVCRVAGDYCGDIRIYVVRTPHFNATMAPNGCLQIWTGLLLRAENEAQLAYVLGHEVAHYVRRHSVQQWRDRRAWGNATAFFKVLASAAGMGFVGPLADLAAAGSALAFSRDNEREADEIGLERSVGAGFDPREAPRIWEALMKERDASKEPTPSIFFASHPPTAERIAMLEARAAALSGGLAGATGRERFLAATLPVRAMLLRDELGRRNFAQTQVVLDRLLASGVGAGELHFFQGELYRLRGREADAAQAVSAYERALAAAEAPVETHRSLGLVWLKRGDPELARASFERYLRARPGADDAEMIRAYLRRLE